MDTHAQSTTADPLLGRTLGDFVVREKIGEGGFGAVYRAEQPLLGRPAVIKVLHGRHQAAPAAIERFLREAKLASRLDHPYAAHIYAFGAEPEGLLWIAMELVRGTPLDALLAAQGRISFERFAPLLDKLCEVLATAHERGIVHRDIKPANVMVLSRAGRLLPKLLDFGIAKALDSGTSTVRAVSTPVAAYHEDRAADAATLTGVELAASLQPEVGAASVDAALTHEGAVIGSPPYMAPEQWINAPTIEPRTDLYALGALTYEALTGRPPFSGSSMLAIARAHAQKTLPPLGEGFPPALDEVLRKAMAKRIEDRYENVLTFASAYRAAAGLGEDPEAVPRLDEALRDAVIADAPQPVADAVAALDASRNVHQGHEALGELISVCARIVGLWALSCRTRVGPARGADGSGVADSLRILRRRTLSDREWVDLARALVRPYEALPDTHPIPELVALFAAGRDPFDAVLTIDEERARAHRSDQEARERMSLMLPHVATLLRGLLFLADYALVVPRGQIVERWTGARRGKRGVLPRGHGLEDEQPALVSREGHPLVSLWPLVQLHAPAPGAQEELFLLEGQGRRGARLVSRPLGFEHRDDTMWDWFRRNLIEGEDEANPIAAEPDTPYRGLSSFTSADAAHFVGREREVEAMVNRLRVQPLIAVVGPSGAGKSSFVHAGVIPALPPDWVAFSIRPGHAPLGALAARLAPLAGAAELAQRARSTPSALRELLLRQADGRTRILVIDQFEEVFTLCADRQERTAFIAALAEAALASEDPVRIVLTLRDDFLMRAQREPALRERMAEGLQLIGTPAPDQLERILVEPARMAGYEFEDRALPAEMVAAIADQPGALPLLSFTASKMWELRDRHFKQLPRKIYHALGGVGGALAQHAEATIAALSAEEQRLVRQALRHLVTAEGTRAVLRRDELLDVMGRDLAADHVAEKLISARLLSASEGENGDQVEIVHEALLSAWPRLVRWRQEDAEGARLRDQLRAAARQWEERARPDGLLWRGNALSELQLWRDRHGATLPAVDRAFAEASRRAATRGRRQALGLVVLIFASLVAGSVVLWRMQRSERASRREAQARVAELYQEQGRQALLEKDPARALVYLLEALRGGRDDGALRFLVARGLDGLAPLVRTIEAHGSRITSAHLSADEASLVTASTDNTVARWDLATGRLRFRLPHPGIVKNAWFTDEDRRIISYCFDGKVRVFDAKDGRLLSTVEFPGVTTADAAGMRPSFAASLLLAPRGQQTSVLDARDGRLLRSFTTATTSMGSTLSSDGRRVAVIGRDGLVSVWDRASGRLAWSQPLVPGATAPLDTRAPAAFTPNGDRLVVGTRAGALVVFDASSGRVRARLQGHTEGAKLLLFSADGRTLFSAGLDHQVRSWDVEAGAARRTLIGHRLGVNDLQLDASGQRLLSASDDGSTRVWDVVTGQELAALRGHRGGVSGLAVGASHTMSVGLDGTIRAWDLGRAVQLRAMVTPDGADIDDAAFLVGGSQLVTLLHGLIIQAWDAQSGKPLWQVTIPHDETSALQLSPDGLARRVLVTSHEPSTTIESWAVNPPRLLAKLSSPGTPFLNSVLSRDGSRVLSGHRDGSARLWDAASGSLLRTFPGTSAITIALSSDGRTAVIGGDQRIVQVWDTELEPVRTTLRGHTGDIRWISLSADGTRIATASMDRTARVWDARTGAQLTSFEHVAAVESVALSPDYAIVATVSESVSRLWDFRSGRLLEAEDATDEWQSGYSFSADGRMLLSTTANGVFKLRSVPSSALDAKALEAAMACRVPFELIDGKLVERVLDSRSCDH